MKHVKKFDHFLRKEVNLNQTRIITLEERVEAVQSFLKNANF